VTHDTEARTEEYFKGNGSNWIKTDVIFSELDAFYRVLRSGVIKLEIEYYDIFHSNFNTSKQVLYCIVLNSMLNLIHSIKYSVPF